MGAERLEFLYENREGREPSGDRSEAWRGLSASASSTRWSSRWWRGRGPSTSGAPTASAWAPRLSSATSCSARRARTSPGTGRSSKTSRKGGASTVGAPSNDAGAVDHFIPWRRYPLDLGHNFVLAHSACNSSKGDRLAAVPTSAAGTSGMSVGCTNFLGDSRRPAGSRPRRVHEDHPVGLPAGGQAGWAGVGEREDPGERWGGSGRGS